MKALIVKFKVHYAVFFIFFLLLFISSNADNRMHVLKTGPAFTDPSHIIDMPEEWNRKPIQYELKDGDADIVVALDQHLYPALLPFIHTYAEKNNLKIVVHDGTCGISAGMLSHKTADIAGFCCPPDFTDRLPGLRYHTLGIAAVALLVHKSNPVDNITFDQAQKLFAGEINNWSILKPSNGKRAEDLPVEPIGRLHCKLRPGHWRLLLDNQEIFSTSLSEVGAIPDMISRVSSGKGTIGYEVLWNLLRYKEKGEPKALKINGYSPDSTEALISGKYPLYRVYNISTWEGDHISNEHAVKLTAYLLEQSEHIGKEHKIIPVSRLRKTGWKFYGNELTGSPVTYEADK